TSSRDVSTSTSIKSSATSPGRSSPSRLFSTFTSSTTPSSGAWRSGRLPPERPARVGGGDLDLGQLQLAAHEVGAEVDRDALVERDAAREPLAAEATVGGEHEALRRQVLQRPANQGRHELGRLDGGRRVVYHADGDLLVGAVV